MTTHLPHYLRSCVTVALTASVLFTLSGCHNVTANMNDPVIKQGSVIKKDITALTPAMQAVIGDYASESYKNRAQGYDWVGVMVRADGDEQVAIKVRARSDLKKPTCQFDGKATLMGQDEAHGIIFQTTANNNQIFFQFKENTLTIDAQESDALSYFCSGGASLAGKYQKLQGPLELSLPL